MIKSIQDHDKHAADTVASPEHHHDHGHDGACDADMSRRSFFTACGCTMLTLSAAGAGLLAESTRAEAKAGGELLKIGHLPAGCVSHLLLAKRRGMFAEAGLNVELTQFNGPAENLQALIARFHPRDAQSLDDDDGRLWRGNDEPSDRRRFRPCRRRTGRA